MSVNDLKCSAYLPRQILPPQTHAGTICSSMAFVYMCDAAMWTQMNQRDYEYPQPATRGSASFTFVKYGWGVMAEGICWPVLETQAWQTRLYLNSWLVSVRCRPPRLESVTSALCRDQPFKHKRTNGGSSQNTHGEEIPCSCSNWRLLWRHRQTYLMRHTGTTFAMSFPWWQRGRKASEGPFFCVTATWSSLKLSWAVVGVLTHGSG